MRFIENGLDIPDNLLTARDEGRVVIFAGAGVSQAKANLPDFLSLADKVIADLGVLESSPAKKLLKVAQQTKPMEGIGGLIPADKIFGLLEREFESSIIEKSVANALRPQSDSSLAAHQTIIDLATGPDKRTRLITTNFDLLFEKCDPECPSLAPPKLPDPGRYDDLIGITHLHGHVDSNYDGASRHGFVLSTSEYGSAYLSEGWATAFIRAIIEKYVVLFVGYSADDPPMQYLLEALRKRPFASNSLYAFHAGSDTEAQSLWSHKGVQPIAYDSAGSHSSLWASLDAWAERARDPDKWIDSKIEMAQRGPAALRPFQRGQIVHIVSTIDGAKRYSAAEPPPPGEWLCTFDPTVRFGRPGYIGRFMETGDYCDPFTEYGLDSDIKPRPLAPDDHFSKRDVPSDATDALSINRADIDHKSEGALAAIRGYRSNSQGLSPRLRHLGAWISRVANQAATVWWISAQRYVHPEIRDQIIFQLHRNQDGLDSNIHDAWRFILEGWSMNKPNRDSMYEFRTAIRSGGWNSSNVREYAQLLRPYFEVSRPAYGRPRPPKDTELLTRDLVDVDVEYPALHGLPNVPDEALIPAVRAMRGNLELAIELESELGGYGLEDFPPFHKDPDIEGNEFNRTYGFSAPVFHFFGLFNRLSVLNPAAAQAESRAWQPNDHSVFGRLQLWRASQKSLTSPEDAGKILSQLSDRLLWGMRHHRDLLIAIRERWSELSQSAATRIETRLIRGPRLEYISDRDERKRVRVNHIVPSIEWLRSQNCKFSQNLNDKLEKLKTRIPDWSDDRARSAASSTEARSGWVGQDETIDTLDGVPLSQVIQFTAQADRPNLSLVEKRPFSGLSAKKPVAALSALRIEADNGRYPIWAWTAFLNSDARKSDRDRLVHQIARLLCEIPSAEFTSLIHPITTWLINVWAKFSTSALGQRLWDVVVAHLGQNIDASASSVIRNDDEDIDWGTEALNSPAGRLAQALLDSPDEKNASANSSYPPAWLAQAENLLSLPGDAGRHALVMFAFQLNRLFWIDPSWVENSILSRIDASPEDRNAFWSGVFWSARLPQQELYQRLKPKMLELASQPSVPGRNDFSNLAGLLLAGWGNRNSEGTRYVNNEELRRVIVEADDEFRTSLLFDLERFSHDEDWKPNRLAFFNEVWPRHKRVNSPPVSARLAELICDSGDDFPEVLQAALPYLTPIDGERGALLPLHHTGDGSQILSERFPREALLLLWTILPENASSWPYGTGEAIQAIIKSDKSLLTDDRLIELRRRWNTR